MVANGDADKGGHRIAGTLAAYLENLPQDRAYLPLADGSTATAGKGGNSQRKGAQMESIVNDYISREIVQDQELLPLSNDTSLLKGGILDSLSLLRLVVFLEERFKLTVDETELLPENFDSVNTICAYLRAREPGKHEAARG
jgi:acyl carrier protein